MQRRHRDDIDGLRGLAVLVVVGYHADLPGFAGGRGGVDVFFVISGYLIAGVIAGRQAAGDFSLAGFWERRIRRILPALLAVMVATTALAASLMPPAGLTAYARSMLAALFSASNLWFWRQSDFFAPSGDNLLLHTWSLGVEEQFYLALPLVMVAGQRMFPRRLRTVLALAALASLAACAWGAWRHPQAAFYLPVTRAWELLLGVLLALSPGLRLPRAASRAAELTGLALIAVATVAIGPGVPLPALAALVPCLGAALVITAGRNSRSTRLLAWPPLVGVGLISYSLYLWHVPLLALPRLTGMSGHAALAKAACLAAAFGLAWLSWRFIERPCRDPAWLSRRGVFAAAAGAVAAMALLALLILATNGPPRRDQPPADSRASTTSS